MEPVRIIRAAAGMTQQELAEAAGTSQPTVAAYESETKSPTWRTLERMASSVGLECYPAVVRPLTLDQRRNLYLHAAIAKELRNRRTEVIEIARRNIDKMRSVNPHAWRLLDEWDRILRGLTTQIVARMLDPGEHARDLRQVTPFAGVLTPAQRADVYRRFRSAEAKRKDTTAQGTDEPPVRPCDFSELTP
ncbi:MAG: helix-turn-helix transcriptional regulator [bacterium]|nr:helix-turn-helix transcriptional regulator [bacterium]MDE0233989.1 helix-turn-helix transcriptional regulator [bacterium]